jgi:hypothetical protein
MLHQKPPFTALAILGLALFALCGWGPNVTLVSLAIAVLLAGVAMLWRPGEPPVMLFVFVLQWLQASTKAISANLQGVHILELAQFGSDIERASYLSLLALFLLAVGMHWGSGRSRAQVLWHARQTAAAYPLKVWLWCYAASFVASAVVELLIYAVPGLSQPMLALHNMKWAFYLILTYVAFSGPQLYRLVWLPIAAFELLLSLGGYFSEFKLVFIYSVLGIAAAGLRVTLNRAVALASVSAITVVFGVYWTVIKPDYRAYVSQGEMAQIVTVGFGDRINYLGELAAKVDRKDFSAGFDKLLDRLAYVDFFGSVLDYVPHAVEHTGGALWWDAIKRPFTPRIIFRDKTIIDDSERTNQFTGLGYQVSKGEPPSALAISARAILTLAQWA